MSPEQQVRYLAICNKDPSLNCCYCSCDFVPNNTPKDPKNLREPDTTVWSVHGLKSTALIASIIIFDHLHTVFFANDCAKKYEFKFDTKTGNWFVNFETPEYESSASFHIYRGKSKLDAMLTIHEHRLHLPTYRPEIARTDNTPYPYVVKNSNILIPIDLNKEFEKENPMPTYDNDPAHIAEEIKKEQNNIPYKDRPEPNPTPAPPPKTSPLYDYCYNYKEEKLNMGMPPRIRITIESMKHAIDHCLDEQLALDKESLDQAIQNAIGTFNIQKEITDVVHDTLRDTVKKAAEYASQKLAYKLGSDIADAMHNAAKELK